MAHVIIVSGFSDYNPDNSFAYESPFLLYREKVFGDGPGLHRLFTGSSGSSDPAHFEAPPYVCYALKQLLGNHGISAEMVFYLDLETERMQTLLRSKADAVFLSTTLITDKQKLRNAVNRIRIEAPDTPIFCGGTLVDRSWAVRKKWLEQKDPLYAPCASDHLFLDAQGADGCGADLFILHDPGLDVAVAALKQIRKGESVVSIPDSLPNCAVPAAHGWRFSALVKENTPMTVNVDWSRMRPDEMRRTAPLIRSRGCPNRCRFCSFQKIAPYAEKEDAAVINEVRALAETHGARVKALHFCDDNFCGSRTSLSRFLRALTDLSAPLDWFTFFDARFIDLPLAEQLRASRCRLLKIGMESANDGILSNMGKPCRVRHYQRAASALAQAGISLDAYFIIGYPGETEATVMDTVNSINTFAVPHASLHQAIFFPFVTVPMSRIFEKAERAKYGLEGYMQNWKHATMDFQTALSLVPKAMAAMTAMQPLHGNLEKLMVKNMDVMAAIDRERGLLIRERLLAGRENPGHWEHLKALAGQLEIAS